LPDRAFDKALYCIPIGGLCPDLGATQDIAITRLRRGRHDAEGYQPSVACQLCAARDGPTKCLAVANGMISGQHQQNVFRIGQQGSQCNRWRRVATNRLEQNGGLVDVNVAQLLGGQEAMIFIADHHRGATVCE